MILCRKQIVSISMIGTDGNLSTVGSFKIIQDAVTELTGLLGIDGAALRDKFNALWVFTKTRSKFVDKIGWGGELEITSYISCISNAKIHVNVVAKDVRGGIVFISKTELCVLDIATQRIRKVSTIGVDESMLENQNVSPEIAFTKFAESNLTLVDKVKIKSTNIDFSYHTNNAEYIRLVMDSYSVEEIESRRISEFEIVYANQSFENDVLDIMKSSFADKDLVVIAKNGKPIVKCEIVF